MKTGLLPWKNIVPRAGQRIASRLGWLAAMSVLVLSFCLATGVSQAQAALSAPALSGSLAFTAPNYQGMIGGPVGTRVTVHGSNWLAYSSVALYLTSAARNCNGAVSVGTFATDAGGSFSAGFLWPAAASQTGAYYACGTQANKGTFFSRSTFTLLSSSPAALSFTPKAVIAGDTITISGSNWLPAPQTINLVIVPCATLCQQPPVAHLQVVTGNDGTFSQQVTISAGAASAGYYVQATNSQAALSATAGPIQVTGQGSPSGTAVPGTNPTTVGTRTTSTPPTTTGTPVSSKSAALKDALLAGGLGLVALLVLMGLIAFFVSRSRGGAERPTRSKDGPEPRLPDAQPVQKEPEESYVKARSLAAGRPAALPQPVQRRDISQRLLEEDDLETAGPTEPANEIYPWMRPRSPARPALPPRSAPAADESAPPAPPPDDTLPAQEPPTPNQPPRFTPPRRHGGPPRGHRQQ